eukprot:jgi/Tetstr1/450087/TSEL_037133.t1
MQALKMQLDGLSTQLEIMEELNQQRASPAINDDEGKGGNETVHDARAVDATEDDDGDDDCAKFFDPHNWLDDLPRAYHDILPRPLGVRHTNLFKPRHNEESNCTPIHRPVETAYIQCDRSGYGWRAMLNGHRETRRFWGPGDERQHITLKELKAARLAAESFLPHLAGHRVLLLHEGN